VPPASNQSLQRTASDGRRSPTLDRNITVNICIDESGTFVYTIAEESWNCVAAYIYPESNRRSISELLEQLKSRVGKGRGAEVKLRDIEESDYVWLLANLRRLDGVLFAIATDASLNTPSVIEHHKARQVDNILKPIPLMHYEEGRQGLRDLADKVGRLPIQLYVQMVSQVQLVIAILHSAVLYFVQRKPQTLNRFRWRIDQKNSDKTEYEEAFSQVLPPFLQSASLREPMLMIEEANYSWFDRFYFPEGEEPTYLQDVYGIQSNDADDRKLNIGKIVGEDAKFVDSKTHPGVQIADLLASGLRRCLRNSFSRNDDVARLLGSLMVQSVGNDAPVKLISFGAEDHDAGAGAARSVVIMRDSARGMLAL
jgi:hypothetical protein